MTTERNDTTAPTPPPVCFMYVGNLESYQGIDLLLDAFALHHPGRPQDRLVIIGGAPPDLVKYRKKSSDLDLGASVDFRGPRPVAQMAEFMREANVLVSPRIKGTNTPMKIYSYLDSGKPLLATRLFTHTQVLDDRVSVLTEPTPAAFARGMDRLAADPALRAELGQRGRELVREKYSPAAFKRDLARLYHAVELALAGNHKSGKKS